MFLTTVSSLDPDYFAVPRQTIIATIRDSGSVQKVDSYVGAFEGSVSFLGESTPVGGPVAFTIFGNDITVTDPAPAAGTVSGGVGSFSPEVGLLSGATFSGSFTQNQDGSITASGTWSIEVAGVSGSGTWTATCLTPIFPV